MLTHSVVLTETVSPGQAALISRSIKGQDCDPINILIRDSAGVRALDAEFRAFLSQCRPLFDTFRPRDEKERTVILQGFLRKQGALKTVISGKEAIFYKEEIGALILRADVTELAFLLKEPRLVAAMEAFLKEHDTHVIKDGRAALAAWKELTG